MMFNVHIDDLLSEIKKFDIEEIQNDVPGKYWLDSIIMSASAKDIFLVKYSPSWLATIMIIR